VDLEPQLRGAPGQGRAHPPGVPARRGGDRHPRHALVAVGPRAGRRRRARHRGGGRLMEKVDVITGTAIPMRRSAVDTDQIIPAEYRKRITKTGYEDARFSAWRQDPEFVLNQPWAQGATVLFAGPDFGTGSSREHAVWALRDYGFRAVI